MKKNIIIGIVIIIAIVVGYLIYTFISPSTVKFLNKNGYIKDKVEVGNYSKVLTNNTFDEYYDKTDAGFLDEYKEYTISPESNNFIFKYLFTKETDINNTLTIIYNFENKKTTYEYLIMNNTDYSMLALSGNYQDNSLTCNVQDNKRISKSLLNNYCGTVKEELIKFIDERNTLTSNDKFMNDVLENNL